MKLQEMLRSKCAAQVEPLHPCNCIGPQNGQPVCPCQMRNVQIVDGRYVTTRDLGPAPKEGEPASPEDHKVYESIAANYFKDASPTSAQVVDFEKWWTEPDQDSGQSYADCYGSPTIAWLAWNAALSTAKPQADAGVRKTDSEWLEFCRPFVYMNGSHEMPNYAGICRAVLALVGISPAPKEVEL